MPKNEVKPIFIASGFVLGLSALYLISQSRKKQAKFTGDTSSGQGYVFTELGWSPTLSKHSRKKLNPESVAQVAQKLELGDGEEVDDDDDGDEVPEGYALIEPSLKRLYVAKVAKLQDKFPPAMVPNTMRSSNMSTDDGRCIPYNMILSDGDLVVADSVRTRGMKSSTRLFVRAGPREFTHFNPHDVRAAVVTCGGLCPGLNNVIREIVRSLYLLYGCDHVLGIRGGYSGFYDRTLPPITMTPDMVKSVHHQGGTFLGSSRGGFDLEKIMLFLEETGVNQLYIIGGDGTHRGAHIIAMECLERGLNIAVAGIPKTIDNDVALIDRSFGFQSSVEEAQAAIKSAKVEAMCNLPRGIGIVKLMGRSSGFIAAYSTLASGDVDLCLVPEAPLVLEGPQGCLGHLKRRVMQKGHAVVVVAEGAGEELLGKNPKTDASGNKILPKIGEFMKAEIERYFSAQGLPTAVKYIDPSYMIRSVKANSSDSLYCMQLAQNAVHGAMAGFTAFTVGMMGNRLVYIPIPELTKASPRTMTPHGRTWERVLGTTRQPNTVPLPRRCAKPAEPILQHKGTL